jgi:hypothetical protein
VLLRRRRARLLAYKENYSITNVFKKPSRQRRRYSALEQAFPAGTANPDDRARRAKRRAVRPSDVAAPTAIRLSRVASAAPCSSARRRRIARFDIVFRRRPVHVELAEQRPDDP